MINSLEEFKKNINLHPQFLRTLGPGRLVVRTPGFHPGNRGSIPRRATKKYNNYGKS